MKKENCQNKHAMEAALQEKKREMQLDEAFEMDNAASATDCTGSVPAAPVTGEQWENHDKTYHFQPQPAMPREKL